MDKHFFPWYKKQSRANKQKLILLQDNAPSHVSKFTKNFLEAKKINGDKLMTWPPSSPDLNCFENLWSILKMKVYAGGRQYSSKNELWETILDVCDNLEPSIIENLTSSMDTRITKLFSEKGSYIGM